MASSIIHGKSNHQSVNKGQSFARNTVKECLDENCIKRPLDGRKYCEWHEVEKEKVEEFLLNVDDSFIKERIVSTGIVWIYFISPKDEPFVKIGSALDLEKRLYGLQTSHYRELIILASTKMERKFEFKIHQMLKEKRIRGEWFKLDDEIQRIIRMVNNFPLEFTNLVENF